MKADIEKARKLLDELGLKVGGHWTNAGGKVQFTAKHCRPTIINLREKVPTKVKWKGHYAVWEWPVKTFGLLRIRFDPLTNAYDVWLIDKSAS